MKPLLFRVSIISGLMLVLTACPYKSRVPISKPSEKVNKDLTGKWVSSGEQEYDNPTFYEIDKLDKIKYEIVEYSYSTYDSSYSQTSYQMHTSTVSDRTFLNIQENGEGDYHLHMIELNENDLTLFEVSDNIDETFNSSEDLKAFIEKHMNLSFFFNKDETKYYRCKSCSTK